MGLTEVNTAVSLVSIFVTLSGIYGKAVLDKIKRSGFFLGNDIITLFGNLAENSEDIETKGELKGLLKAYIKNDEEFDNKLKDLITEINSTFPLIVKNESDNELKLGENSEIEGDIEQGNIIGQTGTKTINKSKNRIEATGLKVKRISQGNIKNK